MSDKKKPATQKDALAARVATVEAQIAVQIELRMLQLRVLDTWSRWRRFGESQPKVRRWYWMPWRFQFAPVVLQAQKEYDAACDALRDRLASDAAARGLSKWAPYSGGATTMTQTGEAAGSTPKSMLYHATIETLAPWFNGMMWHFAGPHVLPSKRAKSSRASLKKGTKNG